MSKLIVSPSPHIHADNSVNKLMRGVLFALLPALLVSFCYFGIGAVIVCAVSVASCVFFEWAISKWLLHNDGKSVLDLSAVLTGVLLAFNLPSNLVGRCFLLVSFPAQMTSWPVPGQLLKYTDATTGATPLSLMKWAIKSNDPSVLEKLPDEMTMLLGNTSLGYGAGAFGEVCALALLLGLAYMLWKRIITWHIPVSIIATVLVFSGVLHLCSPSYENPIGVLLSGGLLLGAIFMATDYVTSPMTPRGQIIYGVAIGFLTIVIRNWGAYPEGMSFAILVMNAFTPLINFYVKPKRFGKNA